jgi:hypothetical protein
MARIRSVVVFLVGMIAVAAAGVVHAAGAQQTTDSGTLVFQVRPANAEITIDGVRWASSDPSQPFRVQLAPGTHHVEVTAPNMQPFTRDVTVRAGETVPLNVLLSAADPAGTPRPRVTPPAPGQQPASPPRPRVPGAAPPPPPPPQSGNIRVVPNEDGFVFAPDVRFTEINGQAGTLVGMYGGMAYGGKLLVGAGAYFQVDGYNGRQMNYFGPVFEYRMFETKTIGLNAHALVGGGVSYGNYRHYPGPAPGPYSGPYDYYYNNAFFVFEPEAQFVVRFSPVLRLQVGLGYRVTSGYNNDGVSGSVSLQIGK